MPEGTAQRRGAAVDPALATLAERQGLQVLAEHVLAERSRIRAVCSNAGGDVVLLFAVDGGDDEAWLTRALAARSWVAARVQDWSKLAPNLPLRADPLVSVRLLAEQFSPETRSAVASLPTGWVELVLHMPAVERPVPTAVERPGPPPAPAERPAPPPVEGPAPAERAESLPRPASAPQSDLQSRFRTGLTDAMIRPASPAGS